MSAPIPDDQLSAIRNSLFQGRKIEAIKLYRKATGTGLADAKDAVDKLEQELKTSSPEKFSSAPARKGCLGVMMFVAAAVILIALVLIRNMRS